MEKFRGVDYYGIDELLTEEQRMMRDAVRDWVEAKFLPIVAQHHRDGTFPVELAAIAASPKQTMVPMANHSASARHCLSAASATASNPSHRLRSPMM